MTIPFVPSIGDTTRYVAYEPAVSTSVFAVTFPVFGDGSDLQVWLDGARIYAWTFTSASGAALPTIPLPITDGVVTLVTAIDTGKLEIFGLWRPRQGILSTSPSINRREYQQDVGQIVASLRELWGNLVSTFPIDPESRKSSYLGFDANGAPVTYSSLTPDTVPVSAAMTPVIGASTTSAALTLLGFSTYFKGLISTASLADLLTAFGYSADIQAFLSAADNAAARTALGATDVGAAVFTAGSSGSALLALGVSAYVQGLIGYSSAANLLTALEFSPFAQALRYPTTACHFHNSIGLGETVRQTVLSGPVTSVGLPDFLPATYGSLSIASQGISESTPLVVSSANGGGSGGANDRLGVSTANLTWSGLTGSATNYLYVFVDADGTLTTGSTVIPPVYSVGGTPSAVANTFTFLSGLMRAYFGNGGTAEAAPIVCVGEAVTNTTGVTSTVAYAYNGRHTSDLVAVPGTSAKATFTHNLGVPPSNYTTRLRLVCATADASYAVGAEISADSGLGIGALAAEDIHNASFSTLAAVTITAPPYGGGAGASLTNANWRLRLTATRSW